MQTVTTTFALNWRIAPEKVSEVFQKLGDEDAVLTNVIDPAISEVLKAAVAKRNVEEILAGREELKGDIDKLMKERMAAKDIIIEDINITDLQFSPEFAKAVEAKQVAQQEAQQAAYDAQKAEQEATAEVNRAKGQSQAQNLLKMTLTKELLQLKAIEKWDGKYPQYVGGSGVPLIKFGDKE
jgi:regulator of protease activity HflC (stomatin/prohibitin superfamily)